MAHRIVVIGGGITGRLVGFRASGADILDWGPPPRNDRITRSYGTNYLWEPLQDIPCRAFQVVTHVDGQVPTDESVVAYKTKINKLGDGGDWSRQFQHETTGYDIDEMPQVPVLYQRRVVELNVAQRRLVDSTGELYRYDRLVSTIPLPSLLQLIDTQIAAFTMTDFHSDPIYVRVGPRPPDAPYAEDVLYVNYLSSPDVAPYRVCDRFGERHWEGLTDMGLTPTKMLKPGKIHVNMFSEFWVKLFRSYDIYCFGRYATWRPDELVHETYREIVQWANSL